MYTILVTQDNELITSVKERIMQRSKLVDSLHFLVDQVYKGIEMKDFTVRVSYCLAGSTNEPKSELLSLSSELYKDKLEYKLPFDSELTREAGDIELSLSFTKSEMDTEGNVKQLVRKTSTCFVTIIPISKWLDAPTDGNLSAIDREILKTQEMIRALDEMGDSLAMTKADNIVLDAETHELYLTADGKVIGNKIDMDDLGDVLVEANSEDGLVTMII